MDRNIILFSLGGSEQSTTTDLTDALCNRITSLKGSLRSSAQHALKVNNIYLTVVGMEIEQPMAKHKLQDTGWMKIDPACDFTLKIVSRKLLEEGTDHPNLDICEELHSVCSHIPVLGAFVEVFWLCDDKLPAVGESLELFGALKCLVSWYNASVTLIQSDSSDTVDLWAAVLGAQTISQTEFIKQPSTHTHWRGSLELSGSQSNYLQVGGFSLDNHPDQIQRQMPNITFHLDSEPNTENIPTTLSGKVLSPKMEYLGELDIGHVPTYYLSGITFQLKLNSNSSLLHQSQKFLNRMKENRWLGCVTQIRYGTGWKEVDCDNHYLDPPKKTIKKSWKDYIADDTSYAYGHPVETELLGSKGQLTFLVYYDSVHQCHTAHLLRQPDEINGAVMHDITMTEMNRFVTEDLKYGSLCDESNDSRMSELISSLPHFPCDSLINIHRKMEELQALVLQQWIEEKKKSEENPVISEAELYTIFCETRDSYMKILFEKYPFLYQPVENLEQRNVIPEWELDPYSRPELIVLANQHTQKSKMSRFKSTDSLGGLSPPSKNQVVMLDAAEFLKFFKADGTAAKENISKLSVKKEAKNSMTSCADEARCASWPDCARHRYHGIQYHGQGKVDEVEEKCIKLKSRLNCVDTSSTCTLEQAHSPASIAVTKTHEIPPDRGTEDLNKSVDDTSQSKAKPRKSTRNAEVQMEQDSKRLYNAKKRKVDAQVKEKEKIDQESRSQRHKRRLQEVVHGTLVKNGIKKDNPIYKACSQRLYTLSKSLVKDLKSSHNLTEQMEKIARTNAPMVIMFEKSVLEVDKDAT